MKLDFNTTIFVDCTPEKIKQYQLNPAQYSDSMIEIEVEIYGNYDVFNDQMSIDEIIEVVDAKNRVDITSSVDRENMEAIAKAAYGYISDGESLERERELYMRDLAIDHFKD